MYSFGAVFVLALATVGEARMCFNATVPVTISARTGVFNLTTPQSNMDVTQFVLNSNRQGTNGTAAALTGYNTTSGTYNISTQFCKPDGNGTDPFIQVLTHGIGFDKTYWDLSYNDYNYSYVNAAIDAGYCTLSYDRLGIGNSSHGEPINEIQAPLEIAALRELTRMLREGEFPNTSNHSFGANIAHVGHSFGSSQSFTFAAMYPNETSGLILTGFSFNSSFLPFFGLGANFVLANQNQPLRFGNVDTATLQQYINYSPFADFVTPIDLTSLPPSLNYPNGYIVSSDVTANEQLFFYPPQFDPQLLILSEQTKQPVTYGELATLGSVPMENTFTGPVLVITGEHDVPYCGGDCLATGGAMESIPAGVGMAFGGNDANFTSYIQPMTGHGINAHYNSTGAYQVITNFLKSKGLQAG